MSIEHFDVLIIGAGLSGIGAACHLQQRCPDKRYAILEGRAQLGGTWDLFRYPGVRSDSDMYTLGYAFKAWEKPEAIADGPSILQYVQAAAQEHGVVQHIRFSHQVKAASWSSQDARWTVQVEPGAGAQPVQITCNFLWMCAGYYSYARGYTPELAGMDGYAGRVVHPQLWPQDIDYAGKRVVVIGSGATAVTLVPVLAQTASHVTMLQRSPSYFISWPSQDALANQLRAWLPERWAYGIARWKQILLSMLLFQMSKHYPAKVKDVLIARVRKALGAGYDIRTHFTPKYKPWDQRLCLVPDGDLFKAIQSQRASVVTDEIARFTATGITLKSGQQLEADLVVTATGLNLQVLGGLQLQVDGKRVDVSQCLQYKGLMYSGIPNMVATFGYTNASWTLKSDLIGEYTCRLLNYMNQHGIRQCTPLKADPAANAQPWVDFSSGYFARSMHLFPKQGTQAPWKLYQNYIRDIWQLRYKKINDGVLVFGPPD